MVATVDAQMGYIPESVEREMLLLQVLKVCIDIYIHIHIYMYICTEIHIFIHKYIHSSGYACHDESTYIYFCIYMNKY
jgi:hypothetical protein